jgi:hypothetical protein
MPPYPCPPLRARGLSLVIPGRPRHRALPTVAQPQGQPGHPREQRPEDGGGAGDRRLRPLAWSCPPHMGPGRVTGHRDRPAPDDPPPERRPQRRGSPRQASAGWSHRPVRETPQRVVRGPPYPSASASSPGGSARAAQPCTRRWRVPWVGVGPRVPEGCRAGGGDRAAAQRTRDPIVTCGLPHAQARAIAAKPPSTTSTHWGPGRQRRTGGRGPSPPWSAAVVGGAAWPASRGRSNRPAPTPAGSRAPAPRASSTPTARHSSRRLGLLGERTAWRAPPVAVIWRPRRRSTVASAPRTSTAPGGTRHVARRPTAAGALGGWPRAPGSRPGDQW